MNRLLTAVIVLTVLSTVQAFAQDPKTVRGTGNNMFPQWSHDGKRIVFTSDRDGDPEIYVMDADGTNPRRVTHSPGRDAHPFFSRDGKKIVFQSPRANGVDTNIYVMNADGTNVVKLTDLKGFAGVPVYSPDEKRIVFQWRKTNNFADDSRWRICLMNSDGSDFRVITPGMANDQVPNWSRDGKRLLFFSDRTGKDQIYTMKPDGTDVRFVAASDFSDNAAFWSRDNRKIAFTSDRDGNHELYVMDSNGKNKRRLTNTRATERSGVWAPDGSRIAFSSDGDGPAHIYVTNLDGSKIVCLTEGRKGDSVLLVSLIGERQVAVIDPNTQNVLARLPSPHGPHEIALSPDATLAYVSDSGAGPNTPRGNSIIVLDLRTLSVRSTLKTCDSPHDTRVSRNGSVLWVACAPAKAVMELDAVTGAVRKTWDTKLDGGWFVEITPDDRKIFVPHLEGKTLSMIDRRTSQVRRLISGNTIFGVTVSPRGNEIWASNADENKLSVVNAATGAVTASVSLGTAKQGESSFSRLRFTPDGKRVVVVRNSEFVIVDAQRRSIVSTVQMPHAGKVVTVSGDSRHAFVSHPGADSISVINLVNGTVERTFVVGKQPDGIAWAPAARF